MCMNKTAKSILLSNSFEKLASVYSAEVLEKLESTAELDTTFRNKAMILADKASVADTEYIFPPGECRCLMKPKSPRAFQS